MIGETLSHYRVTGRLGAGGMGEVYRATDTTLGREVAIKMLPAEVAGDPQWLARFRREAQLLSLLNHPNVAAIYALEEVEGRLFLALELVGGEDVAQRLTRGAIPVDEALEIAVQIAAGLEEAHQRGIIHRDLKPANVKLTPEGKVKVLDFGLAKAWTGNANGLDGRAGAESPTLTRGGTMAGVVLGTAAYMSPEQARGKAVDRRADIWSFGVVLWEMLTGQALFTGETVTDVLAAVVTKEPDLGALPAATPRPVRRLIERCLRKDPRTRLPDISAARFELQEVRAGVAEGDDTPPERLGLLSHRGLAHERRIWAGLTLAAAGLAGSLAFVHLREPPRAPPLAASFIVDPPAGWSFTGARLLPLPSPDGRVVVFPAVEGRPGSRSMLWARSLDSPILRPLVGTEGNSGAVFWSPDSRHLVFAVPDRGELRKLTLADGSVQRLCVLPAEGFHGGSWNEEGTILFSTGAEKGRIYRVAAGGGEARLFLGPDEARGEVTLAAPHFLPGGRRFLFFVGSDRRHDVQGVYVASLDAPSQKERIFSTQMRAQYALGQVFLFRDDKLLAQPFDARRAKVTGDPVTVASEVGFGFPGVGWFGVSAAGTLAYFSEETADKRTQLTWLDRKGLNLGTVGEPADYGQLALSPDGREVALEVRDDKAQSDLWAMDLARGVASRVTTRVGNDIDPVWSPDGRSLAFSAMGAEKGVLRRKGLRATDAETVLTDLPAQNGPECWSRDGQTLLFIHRVSESDQTAWALRLADGKVEPVLDARLRVDELQLSPPDERWLAYVSRESGRDEVYIEPFRREGDRVRVSVDGGGQPKWRRDGQELFYVSSRNELTAVSVRTSGSRLEVGLPAVLFPLRIVQGTGYDDYAPSPDGQRFLIKAPVGKGEAPRLHIVTHWPSLLR